MGYRCILLVVIALSAFSTASAQDDPPLPGEPPQFFTVTAVNDESLVIKRRPTPTKEVDVPNIVYKPAFKTLKATDGKGKALTANEVRRRVKPGSIVIVSPDEDPVEFAILSVIKDDTVILLDILPRKGATGAKVGN
jgi:hypothetical protein